MDSSSLRSIRIAIAPFFALSLLASGCTKQPATTLVAGVVNFDGQPLPAGVIRFVSTDGKTIAEDVAPITAGKYSLHVHLGPKRVEVLASREVPPPQPDMYATREEYIPPRYNVESKLTANVQIGADNVFNFDLESDKP